MLESVLDLLPVAVVVRDRYGAFVFANAAAREIHVDDRRLVARALREPGVAFAALCGARQICTVANESAVITFIAEPRQPPLMDVAAALFGLTPTERRIASLLSVGNNAPQVAAALQSSLHTIHSHLKSIFAKTSTSSQNELIATIRGGLALFGSPMVEGCANTSARLHSAPSVQIREERRS